MKKIRVDKFQIADNPMRKHPQTSIVHLLEPNAIILVMEGHATPDGYTHRHFTYKPENGLPELYTFIIWCCWVPDFDGEQHPIIIDKLLRDAWHWYMAYMAWKDQQIEAYEG